VKLNKLYEGKVPEYLPLKWPISAKDLANIERFEKFTGERLRTMETEGSTELKYAKAMAKHNDKIWNDLSKNEKLKYLSTASEDLGYLEL